MQNKKFAYLKTGTNFQLVTIYKAIKLKNNQIKNRDDDLLFYDTPDETLGELMFTKRTSSNGRGAHFSYYPNSMHSGISRETSMSHKMYQLAIVSVKQLKLYIFGEVILLDIECAYPEFFVRTDYNSFFIDVYLKLRSTEPKSYYYKWSGKLAIEILVSHKVDKSKANDLELNNIQVFELKIYNNQRIPEDISNEEEFLRYFDLVKKKILNHKNIGKLVNSVSPPSGSELEMRYLQLNKYEKDIQELESIIEKNSVRINEQKSEMEENSRRICLLNHKEDNIKEKIKNKQTELLEVETTISSIADMAKQNQILKEQIEKLENTLKEEKEKSFFKKLFGK